MNISLGVSELWDGSSIDWTHGLYNS